MTRWVVVQVDVSDFQNGVYSETYLDETYDSKFEAEVVSDYLNEGSDGTIYSVTWLDTDE